MITQYNICFLILPLSWSKCLTSPYAILEIFLHDLMKNILNSEMTAAFLVARRGPGKFLLQKGDLIPFLFSFPMSLPSPLGFQTLLPVHFFPWCPINSSPICLLSLFLAGGASMQGRQQHQASSPLLCVCETGALISLSHP